MPVKHYTPTSPGRRNAMVDSFSDITTKKPYKPLVVGLRKRAGRNNTGRITVRHRGGGHKRLYRLIDGERVHGGFATVRTIEYDPNRSARIALVEYQDGVKKYILAPQGLRVGSKISNANDAPATVGSSRRLGSIPPGTVVHAVELLPRGGAKLGRAAGVGIRVMSHENKHTLLRLPSGEVRNVLSECKATIGSMSNPDYKNLKLGKAGRTRHRGKRPAVRGLAMAPNAHPHGGGEGNSPIGLKYPKTFKGKPALGTRTRRKRPTDKLILRRRYNN